MSPSNAAPSTVSGVLLDWKLQRRPQSLDVWFKVENQSKQRIYVCDKLLVMVKDAWRGFPSASVHGAPSDPTTANVVVGTPATDADSMTVSPVQYIAIEPGAVHERTIPLGWPLASYNPMGQAAPLDGSVRQVAFEVAAFVGEPPSWRELPAEGGGTLRVPEGFTPTPLRGAGSLPIP